MSSPRFFLYSEGTDTIQCSLCPKKCILPPGGVGQCKVRSNKDGKAFLPFYGLTTAFSGDPIEKKPLYHFRPGTKILSVGFIGCNLRCPFCQNWHISQSTNELGQFCHPGDLAAAALEYSAQNPAASPSLAAKPSLAFTYSEPLVHAEFLLDCMKETRKAGISNVLVTNGCVNSEAAEEILDLCDAANIDLKCFSENTYSEVLGGDLLTVIDFIRLALKKGVHVELTTLVVPGLNDSKKELDDCLSFVKSLNDGKVPWHLSAYYPAWKWKAKATSSGFLLKLAAKARKHLAYVYAGNIANEKNDTICPACKNVLVKRLNRSVDTSGLVIKEKAGKSEYFCVACGEKAPIRF